MNTLSWLIYLSEICGSLNNIFAGIAFVGFTLIGVIWFGNVVIADKSVSWPAGKYFPIIPMLAMFMAAVIPSKNTLMLIAASQYGEKVLESKAVKELTDPALDLVKNWIENENERIKASRAKK